ncbi:MAG: hypothetical protein COB36_11750 [Alphaproteobacteria bacterium]|nr:MAG: hypothetical protein COB36_11750 [Alphaproteobacteria bacterium]
MHYKKHYLRILAVCGLVSLGTIAAWASYWTVPIDYYNDWSYIRYTLDDSSNLYNRGTGPTTAIEHENGPLVFFDGDRGYVTQYGLDNEIGQYPTYSTMDWTVTSFPSGGDEMVASLSLWVQPQIADRKEIIASRGKGSDDLGFTLFKTGEDGLNLNILTLRNTSQVISVQANGDGRTKLFTDNEWTNIIITQAIEFADNKSGPYIAIYVNGYLRGQSSASIDDETFSQWSGILADYENFTESTESRIASPGTGVMVNTCDSTAVLIPNPLSCLKYSERDINDLNLLDGEYYPYFYGEISDFRWYPGINLVCAAKTKDTYQADNKSLPLGQLCDITSDVNSIANDRLEQMNVLARLPYRVDAEDKNWQGLGETATLSSSVSPFTYVSDALRQSVAYMNSSGGEKYTLPENYSYNTGLSFWLKFNTLPTSDVTLLANDIDLFDYDIGLTSGSEISVTYTGIDDTVYTSPLDIETDTWHHFAVTFDGPRANLSDTDQTEILIYFDGALVSHSTDQYINTVDSADFQVGAGRKIDAPDAYISDVLVTNSPITLPQVRRLASRFPGGGYAPAYNKTSMLASFEKQSMASAGYTAQVKTTFETPRPPYLYDSVEFSFKYDWSKAATEWDGFDGDTSSDDCKYVLGGFAYLGNTMPGWEVADSRAVAICFTPAKIGNNVNPFTLLMQYTRYDEQPFYLPFFDPLIPAEVLSALKNYGTSEITNIVTDITLNIGRYNTIVTVKTTAPDYFNETPEFVEFFLSGPYGLTGKFLAPRLILPLSDGALPIDNENAFLFYNTNSATWSGDLYYVDQKKLIDDIDINAAKDR